MMMFDNDWDYGRIAALLGMTEDAFINWKQSMQPGYMAFVGDDDDQDFVIYTDGDDGLIAFVKDCEMFDDGVKIYMGSGYVDITPEIMSEMMEGFDNVIS
jgi:hypothetical protein